MKKYFITSDIHSFYTEFKKELKSKKFSLNNPEHILIICGDLFDRGDETIELYNFIKSIPRDRRILIRGNHESLLEECANKRYFESHDIHNCTNKTIEAFVQLSLNNNPYKLQNEVLNAHQLYFQNRKEFFDRFDSLKIIDWINSDEWNDYYETSNYIFVHSFIPTYTNYGKFFEELGKEPYIDWRKASKPEWYDAKWGCPFKLFELGLYKENKTLVCGHWSCQDFHKFYKKNIKLESINDYIKYSYPYKSKKLIALDACTAITNRVNILVINEKNI